MEGVVFCVLKHTLPMARECGCRHHRPRALLGGIKIRIRIKIEKKSKRKIKSKNLLASLLQSFPRDSVPVGLAILSLAVTIGLAIGAVRVRGVRLGVAGVLFAALAFGQLGLAVDSKVLQFLRDFALILFMYTIGLQVGPGFLASLRAEGLRLNLLAIATLVLGAVMSWAVG